MVPRASFAEHATCFVVSAAPPRNSSQPASIWTCHRRQLTAHAWRNEQARSRSAAHSKPSLSMRSRSIAFGSSASLNTGTQSQQSSFRMYSSKQNASTTTKMSKTGFSYRLAAAYCGKPHAFDPSKHYFSFESSTATRWRAGKEIDKEEAWRRKRLPSGQDACFISTVGHTDAVAFGVADGVGGWEQQGIDSADFSHGLCMYMEDAAQEYQPSAPAMSPRDLLQIAYDRLGSDKNVRGGGSTACIAVADELGTLKVANLGDSGFIQLRLNKVHASSDPQTHAFNTPYQLSSIPQKILDQIEYFGGGVHQDLPSDASVTSHRLQHGDVLVFGTDGVWDNLSSQDLLSIVSERMVDTHAWEDKGTGMDVTGLLPHLAQENIRDDSWKPLHSLLAIEITQAAKEAGMNTKRDGPFARAFQREHPEEQYSGGKPDDIAVIVAIALDPRFEPPSRAAQGSKSKL